jgi:hypothetical protein
MYGLRGVWNTTISLDSHYCNPAYMYSMLGGYLNGEYSQGSNIALADDEVHYREFRITNLPPLSDAIVLLEESLVFRNPIRAVYKTIEYC